MNLRNRRPAAPRARSGGVAHDALTEQRDMRARATAPRARAAPDTVAATSLAPWGWGRARPDGAGVDQRGIPLTYEPHDGRGERVSRLRRAEDHCTKVVTEHRNREAPLPPEEATSAWRAAIRMRGCQRLGPRSESLGSYLFTMPKGVNRR